MEAPDWLDELALRADGPPWLSMGLSRGTDEQWLVVDEDRDSELAERRSLLAERHDDVFAALPGTESAGAETLELVQDWLTRHRPDLSGFTDDPPDGIHPLEAAGRLVQDDLCLMVERDGKYHLDAACLCFPTHWRLADKIGRPAAVIHGPVPHYEQDLADRVDRYFQRLRPEVFGVRRNWSVHESPELFAPVRPPEIAFATSGDGPDAWLRSERQTLRRLPRSGAVLFTIRVQQVPLAVLATRPAVAAAFAARLRAQPAALTATRGLSVNQSVVLDWLDSVAPPD